jgi:hypothetical protein
MILLCTERKIDRDISLSISLFLKLTVDNTYTENHKEMNWLNHTEYVYIYKYSKSTDEIRLSYSDI